MKLTNRDKMLLTIVILAIVWAVGIVFFVKPKIDTVSNKKKELAEVQTQLTEAEADVAAAKTIKDDCNTALKSAQEGAQNFFDAPKAYEAEQFLSKVLAGDASGNGKIDISSLAITGPSATSLTQYSAKEASKIEYPLGDSATFVTDTSIGEDTTTYGETLGCYTFTVSFKARRPDLMKFLTNVKATENGNSLIVTTLSITDNTLPDSEYLDGTMGFSLYFVQKLEGSDIDEVIENQKTALGISDDAQTEE